MKVYFLKENLNSYQIFPIPQNLNNLFILKANIF